MIRTHADHDRRFDGGFPPPRPRAAAGGLALADPIADSVDGLQAKLTDRDFVMDQLAVEVVVTLRESGNGLAAGQIYSLKHPPFLGGEFALDNLAPTDVAVHFSTLGQLAERVKDLPEGAEINLAAAPSPDAEFATDVRALREALPEPEDPWPS